MKTVARAFQPSETFRPANRQALEELESFLRAVDSYPERFAHEPQVSFVQHLTSVKLHNEQPIHGAERRQES